VLSLQRAKISEASARFHLALSQPGLRSRRLGRSKLAPFCGGSRVAILAAVCGQHWRPTLWLAVCYDLNSEAKNPPLSDFFTLNKYSEIMLF